MRASQLVFGPYSPWPVAFRVTGPNLEKDRAIAAQVQAAMLANPHTRQVNQDWGERAPTVHFVLDQARLQLIGLSSREAAEQIQFLLTGAPVTQVREDIRTAEVVARSAGTDRFDPTKLNDMTLMNHTGKVIPLSQVGHIEVRSEEPILKRRDRLPTITVESDIDESLQPPQVSAEIEKAIQPIIASLPEGYKIETGGNIEEAGKANRALVKVFPLMIVLMFTVIIFQVRSFSAHVHGGSHSTSGSRWCRSNIASVSSTIRVQCDPRTHRVSWHPDAQYADPDRPDQNKSGRGAR